MRHTKVEASTQPVADPHTEVGMIYTVTAAPVA